MVEALSIIEGGFEMGIAVIVGAIWISLLVLFLWVNYRFHHQSHMAGNNQEFILENPFDEVAVLEVYSVFGLKINTIDLLPGENKVSLEIANGLYLVCITNRDGKILKTERMIIN